MNRSDQRVLSEQVVMERSELLELRPDFHPDYLPARHLGPVPHPERRPVKVTGVAAESDQVPTAAPLALRPAIQD